MPYIGKSPSAGVRQRYQYTATAGQTTFTGTDLGNLTLTYTDNNFVDVFQNGVLLKGGGTDYTATSGTSVVLATGASVSDVIEIIVYDVFSVGNFFNRTDSDSRYVNVDGDTMTGEFKANGGVVFNEDSADVDFRVESNGNANMFFVDAGNDRIGIGTNSPSVLLDLESTAPVIRFTDSDATGTPECEVSGAGGDVTIRADRDNEKSSSIIGFEVDGSEKMRILSGGGITFNGDTATANALDDYEEGTWTPALTGPSSVAYSSQIGNYTKIGRMVWLSFSMTISSAPTSGSNYRIVIPFDPEGSSSREYGGDIFVSTALSASTASYFLGVYNGSTSVYVYDDDAGAYNGSSNWTTGTLSGQIFINT